MYKYEMHLHSCACSACGVSDSVEMVRAAKEKGYAGVVFTNHFYHGNTCIDRHLPWKEFVEAYKQDYLKAKKFGEEIGFDVFFGIEEGVGKGKEALIYGIDADDIASSPAFRDMTLKEMSDFVRQKGGVIFAAHPFRNRSYIEDPREEPDMTSYDGIEVYNCGNNPEDNDYAAEYAKRTGVATIAGGDVHVADQLGRAGIAAQSPIKSAKELVEILKSGNYRLVINGEIV